MTVPDLTGAGTPESRWQQAGLPHDLPRCEAVSLAPDGGRVVVLAPHPDDEVLGCGGTVAALARYGAVVHVVAVTDGESSHPARTDELRQRRARERVDALCRLGLAEAQIHRLGLPDGGVADDQVVEAVRPLLADTDLLLAPWEYDGHPDHNAVGRAAVSLPGRHTSYLIWAWHWAVSDDLPLDRAFRVPLGDAGTRDKLWAVDAFTSQLEGDQPILPRHVLDRLVRSDEVFIEAPR